MGNNFDKPAYPTPFTDGYGSIFQGIDPNSGEKYFASDPGGMTKLEEFTKAAMQGILSNPAGPPVTPKQVASYALEVAHETLNALEACELVTKRLQNNGTKN